MQYIINTLDQLKPILVGYRKAQGLTQTEMAKRLNVSQQTYQVLEAKPQNVTIERLFRVLTILDVKLSLTQTTTTTTPGDHPPQPRTATMRESSKMERW